MSKENSSSFVLSFKGNAPDFARDASGAVEGLTAAIEASEAEIKKMSADLRRLKGSSDEVKAAKDKLKAAIGAARQEITKDTLELKKHGATTLDVAEKQRRLEKAEKASAEAAKRTSEQRKKQTDALKASLSAIGGPASKATGALDTLSTGVEALGADGAVASIAVAAAAAAVVALGGAAIYGAYKLGSFILEAQSAARVMNLMREAAAGSADNAVNLGSQIYALAKDVPLAREEINKLGIELARMGLRGDTVVDTMNAIAQAQGVGDEALAGQIKGLIERSRMYGRFQLSPQELFGKAISFNDVAAQVAKDMHQTVEDARQALLAGQVPIGEAAHALAEVTKGKFGEVNKKLMLDPSHQVQKFEENLKGLVSDIDIEPLLEDMSKFFDLFDPEKTTSGAAIKQLAESLGGDLVSSMHGTAPVAVDFVRNLVLGALKVEAAWLNVKIAIKNAISSVKGEIRDLRAAFDELKAGRIAGVSLGGGGGGGKKAGGGLLGGIIKTIVGAGGGLNPLQQAGASMAQATSKGFTDKAEIHSPSRLFARHTENIIRGVVDPLKNSQPRVADALNVSMAPVFRLPSAQGVGAGARSSTTSSQVIHVQPHFHVDSERTAHAMASPSMQAQFKKLLVEVLLEAGYGVPA